MDFKPVESTPELSWQAITDQFFYKTTSRSLIIYHSLRSIRSMLANWVTLLSLG
jgi:hypothetical protein